MAAKKWDWPVITILVVIHSAALACIFVPPTTTAIALLVTFFFLAGFGITIGYHRLLSHHAFECSPLQRRVWATLGTMALQGGPVFWVGLHRKHHQFGDKDGDPHSPRNHLLEGHMLWMTRLDSKSAAVLTALNAKDLRELSKDPYIRYLDPGFGPLIPWAATIAVCALVGGLPGVVWGGFLRTVLAWHATWLVNSVGHRFGKRPYATRDASRNVWWLAPVAFGDQWHNNHHARPAAAVLTDKWWQLDVSGLIILGLERLRLVRNVVRWKAAVRS